MEENVGLEWLSSRLIHGWMIIGFLELYLVLGDYDLRNNCLAGILWSQIGFRD